MHIFRMFILSYYLCRTSYYCYIVRHIFNDYSPSTNGNTITDTNILHNTYIRSNINIVSYNGRSTFIGAYRQKLRNINIISNNSLCIDNNTYPMTNIESLPDFSSSWYLFSIFCSLIFMNYNSQWNQHVFS